MLKYNGVGDPQLHILTFDVHTDVYESINAYESSNALKALMFANTFEGNVVHWFAELPPASVYSYNDLCEKFLDHFAFQRKVKMQPVHLYSIVQRPREKLRSFMRRFSDAMWEVVDPSMDLLRTILIHV